MKIFNIKIWFTENNKDTEMVQHLGGLTFADICAIENFIENIVHNKHDRPKFHNELVRLKSLWGEMILMEELNDRNG